MPSFPRSAPTLLRAGIARQPSGAPQALTLRGVRAQSPWPASREWPPPACRRRSRGGALRLGVACTPHRPPARRGRSGRCVWRRCPSRSGRRGPATRRRAPGPRAARRRACPSPPTCASPPSRAPLPWRRWLPRRAHRRRRARGGRARCRGRRGRRGRSAAVSRVRFRLGPRFPPQSRLGDVQMHFTRDPGAAYAGDLDAALRRGVVRGSQGGSRNVSHCTSYRYFGMENGP